MFNILKKLTAKFLLLGAFFMLPFTANAEMHLIDPDDFMAGTPIPEEGPGGTAGDVICDMGGAACFGATLSVLNAGDGKAYAWTDEKDLSNNFFGSSAFSTFVGGEGEQFQAEFSTDVDFVSLMFIANSSGDFGEMTVFLSDMTSLKLQTGEITIGSSVVLDYSAMLGLTITKVQGTGVQGSDIIIDELRFNSIDEEPNTANAVGALSLFSLALGGILIKRRLN